MAETRVLMVTKQNTLVKLFTYPWAPLPTTTTSYESEGLESLLSLEVDGRAVSVSTVEAESVSARLILDDEIEDEKASP